MFNMVFGHVRWQWPVGGESVSQVRHTYHSQTLGVVVTANDSGEKPLGEGRAPQAILYNYDQPISIIF